MPKNIMSISYGSERIEFTRQLRSNDINRVLIKVRPDCKVVVNAPAKVSNQDVIDAVKKRSRWIYTRLEKFREQNTYITPRRYISGESHYYLGRQYMLKIEKIAARDEQYVKLLRGKFEIFARNKSKVKELLLDWYKVRARKVFNHRLDVLLPQALWVGERPQIRIQTMRTQWGSCSPGGRLTLNPCLVKAPRECIDYVILHELCHIAEHNHSNKFYRLMKRVMPNWEKVKDRLDDKANAYLSV